MNKNTCPSNDRNVKQNLSTSSGPDHPLFQLFRFVPLCSAKIFNPNQTRRHPPRPPFPQNNPDFPDFSHFSDNFSKFPLPASKRYCKSFANRRCCSRGKQGFKWRVLRRFAFWTAATCRRFHFLRSDRSASADITDFHQGRRTHSRRGSKKTPRRHHDLPNLLLRFRRHRFRRRSSKSASRQR